MRGRLAKRGFCGKPWRVHSSLPTLWFIGRCSATSSSPGTETPRSLLRTKHVSPSSVKQQKGGGGFVCHAFVVISTQGKQSGWGTRQWRCYSYSCSLPPDELSLTLQYRTLKHTHIPAGEPETISRAARLPEGWALNCAATPSRTGARTVGAATAVTSSTYRWRVAESDTESAVLAHFSQAELVNALVGSAATVKRKQAQPASQLRRADRVTGLLVVPSRLVLLG